MKRMQRLLFPLLALCCLLIMGGRFLGRRSVEGPALHTQWAAPVGTEAPTRSLPAADPAPTEREEKLDLNRADLEALMGLPGIGRVRAESILAYRSAHGGFRSAAELLLVEGIGEATFAGLRDLICVEESDEDPDH